MNQMVVIKQINQLLSSLVMKKRIRKNLKPLVVLLDLLWPLFFRPANWGNKSRSRLDFRLQRKHRKVHSECNVEALRFQWESCVIIGNRLLSRKPWILGQQQTRHQVCLVTTTTIQSNVVVEDLQRTYPRHQAYLATITKTMTEQIQSNVVVEDLERTHTHRMCENELFSLILVLTLKLNY